MTSCPKVEPCSELSRKSLANFAYLWRSSKNAWKRSYGLLTTLRKSSDIFRLEIAKSCSKVAPLRKKIAREMKSWPKDAEHLSVGLSTSCSKFPKKLSVISQKFAQKLQQKSKIVASDNKSCSKDAPKIPKRCF